MVKKREDIPDEVYNENLKILWDVWEKGTEDWFYTFYGGYVNGEVNEERMKDLKENWKTREKEHWYKITKTFMKLLQTIALEDTAYRDYLNFLMMRMQKEMNDHYEPGKEHKLPLYINKYDNFIQYFIEWMGLRGGGRVFVEIKDKNSTKPDPIHDTYEQNPLRISPEVKDKLLRLPDELYEELEERMNHFLYKIISEEGDDTEAQVSGISKLHPHKIKKMVDQYNDSVSNIPANERQI